MQSYTIMNLYPLFFTPLFKYRLWGGTKLRTVLHKEFDGDHIGESWEVSGVTGSETIVSNGPLAGKTLNELIASYGADFLGEAVIDKFGSHFPLLIKFLDTEKPLSVQVHPGDAIAKARHDSYGKNEMWYIMDAEPDAEIIVGFENDTKPEDYTKAVSEGSIIDLLHKENVSKGDIIHIPAGRIHAIGAGIMLAEIQQTSDVTYRVYDYDRVDVKTGKKRDLHTEEATDVLDYNGCEYYKTPYNAELNTSVPVIEDHYFTIAVLDLEGELLRDYSHQDSFTILMCVAGSTSFMYDDKAYDFKQGQTVVLPAKVDTVQFISARATILEVTV